MIRFLFCLEANKLEQEYPQRYQQTSPNEYLSSSYDNGSLPKHYGLYTDVNNDELKYQYERSILF